LIDSSSNKFQKGSDVYISRIGKDFLDLKEVIKISQAHRRMKESFMSEDAIKTVSKISDKKIELSVELSSKKV